MIKLKPISLAGANDVATAKLATKYIGLGNFSSRAAKYSRQLGGNATEFEEGDVVFILTESKFNSPLEGYRKQLDEIQTQLDAICQLSLDVLTTSKYDNYEYPVTALLVTFLKDQGYTEQKLGYCSRWSKSN